MKSRGETRILKKPKPDLKSKEKIPPSRHQDDI